MHTSMFACMHENNCNVKFIVGYLLLYENIIDNNRNNSHYLSHFYEVLMKAEPIYIRNKRQGFSD